MTANFEYKCRKCGAIHSTIGIGVNNEIQAVALLTANTTVENAPSKQGLHLCNVPRNYKKDYGISDLVGMQLTHQ